MYPCKARLSLDTKATTSHKRLNAETDLRTQLICVKADIKDIGKHINYLFTHFVCFGKYS